MRISVKVQREGTPAEGAGVMFDLVPLDGGSWKRTEHIWADSAGMAYCEYDEGKYRVRLVTICALDHWQVRVREPESFESVSLERLPKDGPLGWWHRAIGINRFDAGRGCGIHIGVIDTGINPHRALEHVRDLGSVEEMTHRPMESGDIWGHGTHVCGIICARPPMPGEFGGIAPGATLSSIRVASGSSDGDELLPQDGVAEAIEMLVEDHGVDLINISMGMVSASAVLEARIAGAFEKGVLCICAAGNDGRAGVHYPAACSRAVAVSAVGRYQYGPEPNEYRPTEPEKLAAGDYFFAASSNFGPGIACCAPGVRIISTAWSDQESYVEMTGTSMASPAACAALACLLAEDPVFRSMDRTAARADHARKVLENACRPTGLSDRYEGRGLVQAFSPGPPPA